MVNKFKPITITTTEDLDKEINDMIIFLNETKLDGAISKSKIIRIALIDWLDKQKRIQKILKEHSEINKTAEDILKENGY
jgi:hypothetical protein